jgi:dephospho-CoA kinase
LGRTVIYADALARDLMESDPEVRKEVTAAFGPEAYRPDGTLNRVYLAEKIFSSVKHRKRMNGIVHPFVFQAIDRIIESKLGVGDDPYVLIEAALIYESGMDEMLDVVLLIDAPVEIRAARIAARDGLGTDEIKRRIESQAPTDSLRAKADFVLDNIGDFASLAPKVAFFDKLFMAI